jgi:Flp pilus assembly protein protease CpaA
MTWLFDPRIFNWLIIAMFVAAAIRWAFAGNWPQTGYWLAAAALNIAVLFMGMK